MSSYVISILIEIVESTPAFIVPCLIVLLLKEFFASVAERASKPETNRTRATAVEACFDLGKCYNIFCNAYIHASLRLTYVIIAQITWDYRKTLASVGQLDRFHDVISCMTIQVTRTLIIRTPVNRMQQLVLEICIIYIKTLLTERF